MDELRVGTRVEVIAPHDDEQFGKQGRIHSRVGGGRIFNVQFGAAGGPIGPYRASELRSLPPAGSENRTLDVRVRVNDEEKSRVQRLADEAGQTVSDYIRARIGL